MNRNVHAQREDRHVVGQAMASATALGLLGGSPATRHRMCVINIQRTDTPLQHAKLDAIGGQNVCY